MISVKMYKDGQKLWPKAVADISSLYIT